MYINKLHKYRYIKLSSRVIGMTRFHLLLLCLPFLAFTGFSCRGEEVSGEGIVIEAGKTSTTVDDIKKLVDVISFESEIPKEKIWASIDSLVEKLVEELLILEYGRKNSVTLDEMELKKAIDEVTRDYPGDSFKETLINNCIDYKTWKERLKRQLLIQKIIRRQTELLASVTHGEIKSYYEENMEEFRHPRRAKIIQVITKTKKEAEDILSRLKEGDDMADILDEKSVCSGFQGQKEQWVTEKMFPPALAEEIFSLPLGGVSRIIKTPYGFHLVKVIKKEKPGIKKLYEVIDKIEGRLLNEKTGRFYQEWLTSLRNTYTVNINQELLDRIAKE